MLCESRGTSASLRGGSPATAVGVAASRFSRQRRPAGLVAMTCCFVGSPLFRSPRRSAASRLERSAGLSSASGQVVRSACISRGCVTRALARPDGGGQVSLDAADRCVAPPEGPLDAGLRPGPFLDQAGSLLPGLLAATRTALTPAGHYVGSQSKYRPPLWACWRKAARTGDGPHQQTQHNGIRIRLCAYCMI